MIFLSIIKIINPVISPIYIDGKEVKPFKNNISHTMVARNDKHINVFIYLIFISYRVESKGIKFVTII